MPTLQDIVYGHVREGELYEKLYRNLVRCFACGHCCPIPEGQPGVCKARYNRGGTLYVPWGKPCSAVRPYRKEAALSRISRAFAMREYGHSGPVLFSLPGFEPLIRYIRYQAG